MRRIGGHNGAVVGPPRNLACYSFRKLPAPMNSANPMHTPPRMAGFCWPSPSSSASLRSLSTHNVNSHSCCYRPTTEITDSACTPAEPLLPQPVEPLRVGNTPATPVSTPATTTVRISCSMESLRVHTRVGLDSGRRLVPHGVGSSIRREVGPRFWMDLDPGSCGGSGRMLIARFAPVEQGVLLCHSGNCAFTTETSVREHELMRDWPLSANSDLNVHGDGPPRNPWT